VLRNGVSTPLTVKPTAVQRPTADGKGVQTVSALGLGLTATVPLNVKYGPVDALGASVTQSKQAVVATFSAMKKFPQKLPEAVDGAHRRGARPGDADQRGRREPARRRGRGARALELFVYLFIGLNFFVGIFNLVPLLPAGRRAHRDRVVREGRSWVYAGWQARPGRVDYYKLMPITYAVILSSAPSRCDHHRRHRQPDHVL
jgi:hypothetical protein